jgi:hypothetical protein
MKNSTDGDGIRAGKHEIWIASKNGNALAFATSEGAATPDDINSDLQIDTPVNGVVQDEHGMNAVVVTDVDGRVQFPLREMEKRKAGRLVKGKIINNEGPLKTVRLGDPQHVLAPHDQHLENTNPNSIETVENDTGHCWLYSIPVCLSTLAPTL